MFYEYINEGKLLRMQKSKGSINYRKRLNGIEINFVFSFVNLKIQYNSWSAKWIESAEYMLPLYGTDKLKYRNNALNL